MNVAIVNKYYHLLGGPERYLFAITDLLEGRGHRVVPFCLRLDRNRPTPYAAGFLPPPAGEEAGRLADFRLGLTDRLRVLGRAVYWPEARRRMARLVRQEKIDVVYLLNICNYISPSVIDGARDAGARVVMRMSDFNYVCASHHFFREGRFCDDCLRCTAYGLARRCARSSVAVSLARLLAINAHRLLGVCRKVDAFVAPSRFMARTLVRWGVPRRKVTCLPGFADLDRFTPNYPPGGYALYYGRLSQEKGVEWILRAWAAMGDEAPPLRIVGEGDDAARLRRLARDLNLKTVTFGGFLEGDALWREVARAAFVLAPSLWPENSANTVYEAMALGKPVVAADIGGLPDQIGRSEAGLLVPPGDIPALAEAALRLWQAPALAKRLGRAARKRMETHFTPERHARALEGVLGGMKGRIRRPGILT